MENRKIFDVPHYWFSTCDGDKIQGSYVQGLFCLSYLVELCGPLCISMNSNCLVNVMAMNG